MSDCFPQNIIFLFLLILIIQMLTSLAADGRPHRATRLRHHQLAHRREPHPGSHFPPSLPPFLIIPNHQPTATTFPCTSTTPQPLLTHSPQVLATAIQQASPREDSTRIGSGGVARRQVNPLSSSCNAHRRTSINCFKSSSTSALLHSSSHLILF